MAEKKSSGTGRTRNYASVVYPESAPENWQEILADLKVPAFISPLHDSDTNVTGEKKKDHFHVMLVFEGVKTSDQAKEIFSQIGGVGCEAVKSLRGYARYLCHLDNPEKAQYSVDDVRSFCGADYFGTISLVIDKYVALGEIMDYCDDNHITSYRDLMVYCRRNRPDWFRVLCDNGTFVIMNYLKSIKWGVITVDKDTGEVIR